MNKKTQMPESNQAAKMKKKKKKGFSAKTVIFSLFSIAVLTVVIVCSYVLVNVLSVKYGDMVIDLNDYRVNQNQTSIIYAYDKEGKEYELQRLHGTENRIYVGLDEMPKQLRDAFVALEDKRFERHNGVDWIRFVAVFVKDRFSTGGSSITQQLVKNITDERAATFVRKFNEIGYALNIEQNFDKNQILEAYLNTLYLGEGCYGVKTAAEKYFGKDVSELNLAECSCLAVITKAPYTYDPLVNPENNRRRRVDECLDAMLEQGKISKQEYDEAVNYKLIFTTSPEYVERDDKKQEKKTEEKKEFQSFYVDYIIDSLYNQFMKEMGMTKQQATQKIYYGGLKIYAALDTEVQAALEDVYTNRKTFPNESGKKVQSQSAMTIMDYSGRIVAICGEAGKKSGNRCLNRAAASPRQPGSSIKPISVYGPAIDRDLITWSTLVMDKSFAYQGKQWPKNQSGGFGSGGYVTVQNGLARSLNTVAARVCYYDLTLKSSYKYLTETFKISTANPKEDVAPAPLATGGMNVGITTLEMAAAYASFGNGGKYYKPYCYYKVTNSDGSTVYFDNTQQKGEQIIKEDTADVMCELLQSVTTSSYGTGTPYKISGFQTMAKTGTTSDDYDRWFVGGTPYYVAAVWYGYDLNKTVSNVSGNPSGKIFKEVMSKVHKGLPEKTFPKSSLTVEKKYCMKTGLLAGPNCYSTGMGWYKLKNLPATCNSCKYEQTTVAEAPSNQGGFIEDIFGDEGNVLDRVFGF